MAIQDRNLKPGTILVGHYNNQDYQAEVVVRYRLPDGREFKSLSAAGTAVRANGKGCSGYKFWSEATPSAIPSSRGEFTMSSGQALRPSNGVIKTPERSNGEINYYF